MINPKRIVLVTGSTRGIGLKIAENYFNKGYDVIFNSRNEKDLIKTCKKYPGSSGISADVTNHTEAEKLVNEIVKQKGKLDIIICNVGSGKSVSPGHEKKEDWEKSFSVNLWSATNVIDIGKKYLEKSKGVILCISSICGIEVIKGAPITYSVSKAALHAYVRCKQYDKMYEKSTTP